MKIQLLKIKGKEKGRKQRKKQVLLKGIRSSLLYLTFTNSCDSQTTSVLFSVATVTSRFWYLFPPFSSPFHSLAVSPF